MFNCGLFLLLVSARACSHVARVCVFGVVRLSCVARARVDVYVLLSCCLFVLVFICTFVSLFVWRLCVSLWVRAVAGGIDLSG